MELNKFIIVKAQDTISRRIAEVIIEYFEGEKAICGYMKYQNNYWMRAYIDGTIAVFTSFEKHGIIYKTLEDVEIDDDLRIINAEDIPEYGFIDAVESLPDIDKRQLLNVDISTAILKVIDHYNIEVEDLHLEEPFISDEEWAFADIICVQISEDISEFNRDDIWYTLLMRLEDRSERINHILEIIGDAIEAKK